jgi:hypothetical protein
LLGEEFGVHLPRALTSFIASLGPIGAAMEMAFPFLAIAVGATLLLEHLSKLKEEGEKLTTSQMVFGTTVANVLNGLDEKLLQAGIRTDELNHNHLSALNKELQLIDKQSMSELVRAFDTVAKAADVTFAELKTSWYSFSAGSAGAKHTLEEFKAQYESLIAQGKDTDAKKLLDDRIEREQRILNLQKQQHDNQVVTGTQGSHGNYAKAEEATLALKAMGVGYTEKETAAQEILVDALHAQEQVTSKINTLKEAQKANASQAEGNRDNGEQDSLVKRQFEEEQKEIAKAEARREQAFNKAVAALQENEKEKIDATKQGSAARLTAIDQAIQQENSKGLQETSFYRGLLLERVNLTRQMAEEQTKLEAEAGKESAAHGLKMGQLAIAAEQEKDKLLMSAHRITAAAQEAEARKVEDAEYQNKLQAAAKEIASLDKTSKDYENKLKAAQNRELELTKAHENKVTQIRQQAAEDRNHRILAAEQHMDDAIASSMSKVLMKHESFAKSITALGDQVVSGMMQTAIKSVLANDFTKESDAAAAARKAYLAGMHFPFPANIIMGPALGAMAFASVMAFEQGGIVPGVGNGDTVPAMLTPGEGVIPKQLMENMANTAKFDGGGAAAEVHIHHSPTYHVQAIDRSGVREMLNNHRQEFTNHFHSELRKMNK